MNYLNIFILIFLSSLPGRTTFLMILMSSKAKASVIVRGAFSAFFIQSMISVFLGQTLSFIPVYLIKFFSGTLFLFFSFKYWKDRNFDVVNLKMKDPILSAKSIFIAIFVAEWGDISQVAIATLASQHSENLVVFSCSVAALWAIVGFAIAVGSSLHKFIYPKYLQIIASVGFAATGIYMILGL